MKVNKKPSRDPKALASAIRVNGGRIAYWHTRNRDGWIVILVSENERGYRPVAEYGPYKREAIAKGIAGRLNERLRLDDKTAAIIVARSMR